MKASKAWLTVAILAAVTAWGLPPLRSEDAPPADDAPKEFPFDKGPDTIDVSKYPKEQQENYAVFAEKCAKCHTLARPINAPFALPEEWSAYVDKMRHKKHSGIDEDTEKQIVSFLTYDSSVRKKDLIEKKLKEKAAAGDKKADDSKGEKAAPAAEGKN